MFLFGYVLLVLLAALPLGRTFLKERGSGSPVVFLHRLYRDLAYIAAAVLAIICFEATLNISLQNYWFEELGQRYRYWLALGLRLAIFFTVLVSVGVFVGYNLRALCRPLPAVPRSAPWFAAFIFSALVAFGATTLWIPLLGFLGATSTGTSDPVFGKDISFYLLALPWYDAVVSVVITVLVITIALWALIGLAFYPSSGRPWDQPGLPPHVGQYAIAARDRRRRCGLLGTKRDDLARDGCARAWCWRMLFCVTIGRVPLSRPVSSRHRWAFDRSLRAARMSTSISGSRHTTSSWFAGSLPLSSCWSRLVCRGSAPGSSMRRVPLGSPLRPLCDPLRRSRHRPAGRRAAVRRSKPNNPRAALFSLRSIAGTREAYNLDGPSVEEQEFAVSAAPLTREDLDKNATDAARRPHLGLASARTPAAADPGPAAVLHLRRCRHRPLHDRWRRAAGHDHRA